MPPEFITAVRERYADRFDPSALRGRILAEHNGGEPPADATLDLVEQTARTTWLTWLNLTAQLVSFGIEHSQLCETGSEIAATYDAMAGQPA